MRTREAPPESELPGEYAPDRTFAGAETLRGLAETYGTPLLVYDRGALEARARWIREAFSWNPGFRQFFPVRAADNPAILQVLLQAGCGLVCGSGPELRLASLAGATGPELLFHAAAASREDMEAAVESGAAVILDSPEQLDWISPQTYGDRVLGLRYQPGRDELPPGCGRESYRFGMRRAALLDTGARAVKLGFRRLGLHMQALSVVGSGGYYASQAGALCRLALELRDLTGVTASWCDLGGGLMWDPREQNQVELPREAAMVGEKLCQLLPPEVRESMGVFTEFGRCLAAPCGILLSTVRSVKNGDNTWAGLDVSMAHLPRASLTRVYYHVSKLGDARTQGRAVYHLAGAVEERIDNFEPGRVLPRLRVGDLVVFHDVGAYSRSMASNYGGTLRCPEVLLEDGVPRLIRRRETWEDVLGTLVL